MRIPGVDIFMTVKFQKDEETGTLHKVIKCSQCVTVIYRGTVGGSRERRLEKVKLARMAAMRHLSRTHHPSYSRRDWAFYWDTHVPLTKSFYRSTEDPEAMLAVVTEWDSLLYCRVHGLIESFGVSFGGARILMNDHMDEFHSEEGSSTEKAPRSSVLDRIHEHRRRQVEEKGYTPEGDVGRSSELCHAAMGFAFVGSATERERALYQGGPWLPPFFPWGSEHLKMDITPVEDLIKAAALLVAAIEAKEKEQTHGQSPDA